MNKQQFLDGTHFRMPYDGKTYRFAPLGESNPNQGVIEVMSRYSGKFEYCANIRAITATTVSVFTFLCGREFKAAMQFAVMRELPTAEQLPNPITLA